MTKQHLGNIKPYVDLYRDDRTGIAIVEDGTSGTGHGPHPSIDSSGSVRGMKELGHWRKDAQTVRALGYIFNTSVIVVDTDLDRIAWANCECGGPRCPGPATEQS